MTFHEVFYCPIALINYNLLIISRIILTSLTIITIINSYKILKNIIIKRVIKHISIIEIAIKNRIHFIN